MKLPSTLIFSVCAVFVLESCLTKLTRRDGTTWLYKKPISFGRGHKNNIDTARFIFQNFKLSNFENEIPADNGKRIIEVIEPKDLKEIMLKGSIYIVYLYLPGCGGTPPNLHRLDSAAKKGEHIIPIALSQVPNRMNALMLNTAFARYPLYVLHTTSKSNDGALNKIAFLKEVCPVCDSLYKDELLDADYLLIENKKMEIIMFNVHPEKSLFRN